jgi:hypothetical protein
VRYTARRGTLRGAVGARLRDRAMDRICLGIVMERSLAVRSPRGILAASVCLLAVPVALVFQLMVGSGAELVLHLVGGVGCLLTAFAVFDFKPPRWLPWVGCLSIGAFGATFLLQGISQLLHNDWLTYLAFQILGQQIEGLSADIFLVWCGATVLLMSHDKVKLFGIGAVAVAVGAEIYSNGVRYLGSGVGGVSPLLKLTLLLPFVWLLLESSKKIPLPEAAETA